MSFVSASRLWRRLFAAFSLGRRRNVKLLARLSLHLERLESRDAPAGIGQWSPTGSMIDPRDMDGAALLGNGLVLVAGGVGTSGFLSSAELYNPLTQTWSSAGTMDFATTSAADALLGNGDMLVAGGYNSTSLALASAQIYNPTSNTWSLTASMAHGRQNATAVTLANGKVLVVGGFDQNNPVNNQYLASAELFDPATDTWSSAEFLSNQRVRPSATLLPNGYVLVAGGTNTVTLATVDLYNPSTDRWLTAGSMSTPRDGQAAILLRNGKVLVAGGDNGSTALASAELYDPATNSWSPAAPMPDAREFPMAALLPNGDVLVAGGVNAIGNYLPDAWLYDPTTNSWASAGSMITPREYGTATSLNNGTVLFADGTSAGGLANAELYNPYPNVGTTTAVTTSNASPTYGTPVTLTATVAAAGGTAAPGLGSVRFFVTNGGTTAPVGAPVTMETASGSSAIFTLVTSGTSFQAGQTNALSAVYTAGTGFSNSTSTNSVSEAVTPLTLGVSGITANNKTYDGTTVATLNTSAAGVTGVLGNDAVTLVTTGATGAFANAGPGNNVPVTVSGLSLTGAQAADYTLPTPQFTAAAIIVPTTTPPPSTLPAVIIGNKSVLEGAAVLFQVTLASAPSTPVTYDVFTSNGTAMAGTHFTGIKAGDNIGPYDIGTLHIPAGFVRGTITVKTIAGSLPAGSPSKSFTISVSRPTNPTAPIASATASIVSQATGSTVQSAGIIVGNQYGLEGARGTVQAFTFQVKLSHAPSIPVTYDVFTTNGTAVAGTNYYGITAGGNTPPYNIGTVTFSAGNPFATVTVHVIGGSLLTKVSSKTFTVSISDPLDPQVALASATGTIE